MNTQEPKPSTRVRVVIEMSLLDADPSVPIDFPSFLEHWMTYLEEYPRSNCKDVVVRQMLTIDANEDDYDKWRGQDLSGIRRGVRIYRREP